MKFELFIARRYLLARRKQSFISIISMISVAGVALGVASLIVVLGVMNGFSTNLRNKILGVNAHVVVGNYKQAFPEYREMCAEIASTPGVKGTMPFIYSEVMLSVPAGVKGIVLRGIDPDQAAGVLSINDDMVSGSISNLKKNDSAPGIIIGSELAKRLGIGVDTRVNILSPSGKKSAAGFSPKIEPFIVQGIFDTGMYEYDSSLAYTSIDASQDILGLDRGMVTGVEVKVEDVYKAREAAKNIESMLGGYPFYVRDWMEMNENLFSALKLEKTAMAVILIMIVLVGSFSIVTTLIMLVMEKTRDIAILMSMGATSKMIRNIFVLQGLIIGAVGTALGFILGLGTCWLLQKYQFIELPQDIYYLDHLPVLLQSTDLLLIGGTAMLLCFLATLYPARQASGLNPSEALRYE
ncbi:MAG: lipoprotein-releasing ABC transporter permease subunit [Thermodesulfobacteriota bacterium]